MVSTALSRPRPVRMCMPIRRCLATALIVGNFPSPLPMSPSPACQTFSSPACQTFPSALAGEGREGAVRLNGVYKLTSFSVGPYDNNVYLLTDPNSTEALL